MKGGKFLILGPRQADPRENVTTHAAKYFVLHSPTYNICVFLRALDPDPKKAQQWNESVRLYPYSKRGNPPAIRILTPGGKAWNQTQPRGMTYWERLANIVNQEPVIERDRVMMGMLKPLGIEKGKPVKPDARQTEILTQAAFVGEGMAETITFAKRFNGAKYRPDTQWAYGLLGNPEQESEFYTQIDERTSLFFEGTGASKRDDDKDAGRRASLHWHAYGQRRQLACGR